MTSMFNRFWSELWLVYAISRAADKTSGTLSTKQNNFGFLHFAFGKFGCALAKDNHLAICIEERSGTFWGLQALRQLSRSLRGIVSTLASTFNALYFSSVADMKGVAFVVRTKLASYHVTFYFFTFIYPRTQIFYQFTVFRRTMHSTTNNYTIFIKLLHESILKNCVLLSKQI